MPSPALLNAALLLTLAAVLTAAAPAPKASSVPLGRANPFKPLIGAEAPEALASPPPGQPDPLGAPILLPPALPKPIPSPPAFVAIAWDGDGGTGRPSGAVAALRIDGRTRFVRVGETVAGARVVAINNEAVTLRSATRTQVIPLAKP